ncbi:hypothetical protein GCK72_010240 [Caenorhabditis remanei]|uniref:Uncharacterized protein n=1 Tax=Caenorhabditis remanei TaxID=31234 RepID=A0A6A5H2C1_CAERE|nr:hypothetical protein GCK72_010240 [Caenorhabditis remanei]KAF1761980.1 hypothetical protein GCK72_010240 [Caenorhabditis remanei]
MHHASEKKKRDSKNPQVSVRLNVRPLRANWKPVKRYECDEVPMRTKESPSPAEDQLDCAVWRTKHVRTDIVKPTAVVEEGKTENIVEGNEGLLTKCECASCERADETPTALELSPKQTRDDLYLEKKKLKEQRKKKEESKASKMNENRRRRHRHHSSSTRSASTPPLVPPNSVASLKSQDHWHKLFDEVRNPAKIIDFSKIPTVSGQIGMSELEPEDPATPPPTSNDPKDIIALRSPNLPILKPPNLSSPSNVSELYSHSPVHQPPLVPLFPTQPQPNVVILPAPICTPPKSPLQKKAPAGSYSDSNSSLVFMPPSSPIHPPPENALLSTSNISMIQKMENLFYGSESNWWFLIALIMLTIFAYRSTMEQHTCYYD